MVTRTRDIFTTATTEGALLPPDILQRIVEGDASVPALKNGLKPNTYHLSGERLNEATSRAWNRLQAAWKSFRKASAALPEDDIGTTITREHWLLPLFSALDYGRLETATAVEIDGRRYAISHRWRNVPIHLLGCKVELDERTKGVAGAATGSPHSLLQVFLNKRDENLWGFLSNGLYLRILRDNMSLTRQAYIEFDLEAMMEGEVYADFVLLYLLCHQSRVEAEKPTDFWLEKWMMAAREQGTRALDELRNGVEKAISELGRGFLAHPRNTTLRDALQGGSFSKQDYYRELLRLVYRLLFLFVAEDRDLLHPPQTPADVRQRYHYYSTKRLREIAANLRGTRHHDLYEGLRLVMQLLGGEVHNGADTERAALLGLPVLGSFLFSREALSHLADAYISNAHLLEAIRAVSTIHDVEIHKLRAVDFKNLGAEELGSVYESLLELNPQINVEARTFNLTVTSGHERKTTGSYYTPTSLIEVLLDSALDPVLDAALTPDMTRAEMEQAILNLKVCDPASGSGHFLIAAANRIARRLAAVRTGEEEPPPEEVRHARRDVIAHCIYGVDLNPMAVELCKVNLWMEALEPGLPLTFLDSHIQHGNSLLGATPALMANGIPEDVFPTKSGLIEGDDYELVKELRTQNRTELKERFTRDKVAQRDFFYLAEQPTNYSKLAHDFETLDNLPDDTPEAVRAKERRYHAMLASDTEYRKGKFLADLWCAAFVWRKAEGATYTDAEGVERPVPPPITDRDYHLIEREPLAEKYAPIRRYVAYLSARYDFLHWHIAFPDVFNVPEQIDPESVTGWHKGFDCVLGNPPWERIKLQEKEWFAGVAPEIAEAPRASVRRKMIEALKDSDSPADRAIYQDFLEDKRIAAMESHVARSSGRYPLTGRGDINTYQLFAGLCRQIVEDKGIIGIIVPSGIATDYYMQEFFNNIMQTSALISLYDFENREGLFPTIDSRMKFCLLTIGGSSRIHDNADFIFFAHNVHHLKEKSRIFTLSFEDVKLLNPNTKNCPIFRSKRDANIVKSVYKNLPILEHEDHKSGWGIEFFTLFHMSNDSNLFFSVQEMINKNLRKASNHFIGIEQTYLPLYEARMISQFDHRNASVNTNPKNVHRQATTHKTIIEQYQANNYSPTPRYWVNETEVNSRLPIEKEWWLSYRTVTSATNERTSYFCVIPKCGASNMMPLLYVENEIKNEIALLANMNSFVLDYILRQKFNSQALNFYVLKQLAVFPPQSYIYKINNFIIPRVLELSYTAWDLQAFAQDIGYDGPPFVWDEERRFLLRCELDALYFHLYQIDLDDAAYIMDTFPIVRRKDEEAHGHYRTKATILEMYEQMAALPTINVPHPKGLDEPYPVPDVSQFETWLSPPPADPRVAHEDTRS